MITDQDGSLICTEDAFKTPTPQKEAIRHELGTGILRTPTRRLDSERLVSRLILSDAGPWGLTATSDCKIPDIMAQGANANELLEERDMRMENGTTATEICW